MEIDVGSRFSPAAEGQGGSMHRGIAFPHTYVLVAVLFASSPSFGASRIFGPGDGLLSNLVYSIIEDREGHILFGTAGGVSYSDGVTFARLPGSPSGSTWGLLEDRAGILWVGASNGRVARRENGVWCEFGPSDGVPPGTVSY